MQMFSSHQPKDSNRFAFGLESSSILITRIYILAGPIKMKEAFLQVMSHRVKTAQKLTTQTKSSTQAAGETGGSIRPVLYELRYDNNDDLQPKC